MKPTKTDAYGRIDENPLDDGQKPPKRVFARHNYEKFFAGYTVEQTPLTHKPGVRAVRVYTGALYRQELPEKQRVLLRVLHAVLFLAAVVLLLVAVTLPVASNRCGYVALCGVLPAILLVRLFFVLVAYLPSKGELRIHEYQDGAKILPTVSLLCMCSFAVPVLATVVMFPLTSGSFSAWELVRLLMLAAAALIVGFSGYVEKQVSYIELFPSS